MRNFRAILAMEGVRTDEGMLHRRFDAGAFTWRELPLTLRAIHEDFGGHGGAFPIGRIDAVERVGLAIVGTGILDDEGTGEGADQRRDVIRQIENGTMTGVSVDPGALEIEETCVASDADGWCTDVEMNFVSYQIGAATVVPIPALEGTMIEIVADDAPARTVDSILNPSAAAVVASGSQRVAPPAEWFDDPQLEAITRHSVITEDGRIFGHLAGWDDCHISFPDRCQRPWDSPTDFAYFHTCSIATSGGERRVGPIAANGGHANTKGPAAADWRAAQAVYDDPATCTAYVALGRDAFGIWYAGAIRPEATEEQVNMLQTHQLSGDWRRIGGEMEVVGACAVNVPGFVRTLALTASGEPLAAVIAGGNMKNASNQSGGTLDCGCSPTVDCGCGGHTGANAIMDRRSVASPRTNGKSWDQAGAERLERHLALYDDLFGVQLRERLRERLNT